MTKEDILGMSEQDFLNKYAPQIGGDIGKEIRDKMLLQFKQWQQEAQSQNLNNMIQNFSNTAVDPSVTNRNINLLGQQLASSQTGAMNQFNQNLAARTGGRISGARGQQDIAGQYALAQQQGVADILNKEAEQKFQAQLAQLQTYVQKYGMDQQALQFMQQIMEQRDLAKQQANAQLLGSVIGLGSELLMPKPNVG